MRIWLVGVMLLGLSLGLAPALQAGGVSCTTRWDAGLQRYDTRCTDGRQFSTREDRAFQRWQTRERPPWKPVEPKGKRR
jgi:hypothetical protein